MVGGHSWPGEFRGALLAEDLDFQILVNRARTRGTRERRITPFSSLAAPGGEQGETVDPDRFLPPGSRFEGYWAMTPSRFFDLPEERLLAQETTELVQQAIEGLPARQQQVIRLRDIEGWQPEEVCDSVSISAANQRVLLHRARAAVRAALESHFTEVVVT